MSYNVFPAPSVGVEKKAFVFPDGQLKSTNVSLDAGTYLVSNSSDLYEVSINNKITTGKSGALYLTTSATTAGITYPNPGLTWTSVSSAMTTSISQIAYGNNILVAVGFGNQIATSPTGTANWTSRTGTFGTSIIEGVTFGNGVFVAVGRGGNISSSTNGITWTSRTGNFSTNTINAVTFGNGIFVAGSTTGQINTSTDGVTWTTSTTFSSREIDILTYKNNLFLMGANNGLLATSTDGTTWTTRTTGLSTGAGDIIQGITYGNDKYLVTNSATSTVSISTNGITWTTQVTDRSGINQVRFTGSYYVGFIIPGSSNAVVSTDTITWTLRGLGGNPYSVDYIPELEKVFIGGNTIASYSTAPSKDVVLTFEKLEDATVV
jgi:hypothetical protein